METDTRRSNAGSGYASGSDGSDEPGFTRLASLAVTLIALGVLLLWLDTLGYGRV